MKMIAIIACFDARNLDFKRSLIYSRVKRRYVFAQFSHRICV